MRFNHTLIREQVISRSLSEVFPFFAQPENLARITPAWMGFRVTTPTPIQMAKGLEIAYRIRIGGLPSRWVSRITHYDPPRSFVDEQIAGPYKFWRHLHRFLDEGHQTRVIDEVKYNVGWGYLGEIAHTVYVRRTLESIFDYRQRILTDVLGATRP